MVPFGPNSKPGATRTKYRCPKCGKTWTAKDYIGKSEMEKKCSKCKPKKKSGDREIRCPRCGGIYMKGERGICPHCD